jgi:transposase
MHKKSRDKRVCDKIKQQQKLVGHLENNVYLTAKEICAYVLKKYKVAYTVKGMTSLLHTLGFRYKKPRHVPGKANIEAQLEFINAYDKFKITIIF